MRAALAAQLNVSVALLARGALGKFLLQNCQPAFSDDDEVGPCRTRHGSCLSSFGDLAAMVFGLGFHSVPPLHGGPRPCRERYSPNGRVENPANINSTFKVQLALTGMAI